MVTMVKFPELTFDERRHIYKLNGMAIPSVTTVMQPLSDNVYGNINDDILRHAAARGTAVHEAIENFVKFGIEDIPPEYKGYFNAFLKWYEEHKVKPNGTEIRLYHKSLMYAGTADMAAEVDGEDTLVDFKTSASIQHMLCGVQLEAYSRAWESHTNKNEFKKKAIVHLRKDETYEMVDFKSDLECWRVFTALLTVRNYKQKFTKAGVKQ